MDVASTCSSLTHLLFTVARALSDDRAFTPDERGFLEAVIENIETLSRLLKRI